MENRNINTIKTTQVVMCLKSTLEGVYIQQAKNKQLES